MRILTLENTVFDLDTLPEEIDDMRFAIFDNSDPTNADHFYIPLIFLETFNSPALVLKIGNTTMKMPIDWQVLIGEPDVGDLEMLALTSINDRGFKVFEFNPLTSFSPTYLDIEIVDVYQDVTWYVPKLKNGQMLAVPIDGSDKPRCVYFVKDISRNCEIVDITQAF
jgi:hypothetical protein|tara:strand:+ start:820 stop:1320 length:501 start_codon:yes stop_codon:yes gene_type:complete